MAKIIFKGSQLKITPNGMKTNNKPAKLADILHKSTGGKTYKKLNDLFNDVEKQLKDTK